MNAYGHQTFQGGGKPSGDPIHKIFSQLNGVVLWGQVTNKLHVSSCRRLMGTKLGKVLTYCERFPLPQFEKPIFPLSCFYFY